MVKQDVATAIMELIDYLQARDLITNSFGVGELITAALSATSGSDLTIANATGKDIKFTFTDNAGARKMIFYDSDSAEIGSIDSNGVITSAGGFKGDLTKGSTDLTITAATGKDIIFICGDDAGAKKLIIKDSGGVEVASIDSNGAVAFTAITSSLTGDVINNNVATHDYSGGHADWTLSSTEKKALVLSVTNSDQASNIIGPAENRMYIVKNGTTGNIVIKKTGQTGVTIGTGKTAVVYYNGTDYARATADATH